MGPIKSLHMDLNKHYEGAETFLSKWSSAPILGLGFAVLRDVFACAQAIEAVAFIAIGIVTAVFASLLGFGTPDRIQNCKDLIAMGFEHLGHAIMNEITAVRELLLGMTLVGNYLWQKAGHEMMGGRAFEPFFKYDDVAVDAMEVN